MFSAFRMGPTANAACVISMEYYSELLNHVSKIGMSRHGENIPIRIKIEKAKLLVYFRRAETSQFLIRDLATLSNIPSISHSLRQLTVIPIAYGP